MKCRQCGTQIADHALICFRCGTSVKEAVSKPYVPGTTRRPPVGYIILAVLVVLVVTALLIVLFR